MLLSWKSDKKLRSLASFSPNAQHSIGFHISLRLPASLTCTAGNMRDVSFTVDRQYSASVVHLHRGTYAVITTVSIKDATLQTAQRTGKNDCRNVEVAYVSSQRPPIRQSLAYNELCSA